MLRDSFILFSRISFDHKKGNMIPVILFWGAPLVNILVAIQLVNHSQIALVSRNSINAVVSCVIIPSTSKKVMYTFPSGGFDFHINEICNQPYDMLRWHTDIRSGFSSTPAWEV